MTFVDTSFWVAYRNRSDGHHAIAQRLLETHSTETLVTTNEVRGETWTFLRRRAGHRAAVHFLDALEASPRLRLVSPTADTEAEAWQWLRQRDDREYSYVDSISFAVMRTLGIRHAFAFDGDFSAAGFEEMR